MTVTSQKPQPEKQATPRASFISTALRMKQEADAAIQRGKVAALKAKGFKLLSFDA